MINECLLHEIKLIIICLMVPELWAFNPDNYMKIYLIVIITVAILDT